MNTENSSLCPECGKPLPTSSQHGVCPACLMAQALASGTIAPEGAKPAARIAPPSPEEIADKFPQFEILECLGRGGMGVVYKARQKSLNRTVAIKILAPERERDARFAARFAREAELLAKLSHPHIVTVHDFGEAGGLYYFVMEFVDGVNLRDLLRDGKIEPKQALAIVPPVCEALQYAHEKGIVHRDIKPENLLLDREGRVKIADFGIAALVGAEGEPAGTPPYMAPEQTDTRREVDSRADIYALGVVLYEMLTGERPGKDVIAPSRKVQIDVRLDEVVLRALEKKPELRYQQASVLKTQVETIALTPGSSRREEAQTELSPSSGMRWNFWGFLGSALGSCLWMPVTAISSGWSGAGVALSDLTAAGVLVAALAIWSNRHRLMAFQGFLLLLGAVLVASATFLLGAYWMDLPVRSSWPDGRTVSPVSLLWTFLLPIPALAVWGWLMHKSGRVGAGPASAAVTTGQNQHPLAALGEPRFSRTAIVGACWAGFSCVMIATVLMARFFPLSTLTASPLWRVLTYLNHEVLGLSGFVGTTILGWVAVSQIRHSAGKLHGLGLAVFDGLLFPLLALDGLIFAAVVFSLRVAGLGWIRTSPPTVPLSGLLFVAMLFGIVLLLDFLIIRRVWRAVNPSGVGVPPVEQTHPRSTGRGIIISLVLFGVYVLAIAAALLLPALFQDSTRYEVHYRVFEVGRAMADKCVPAAQRQTGATGDWQMACISPETLAVLLEGASKPPVMIDQHREIPPHQSSKTYVTTMKPGVKEPQQKVIDGWPVVTNSWVYSQRSESLCVIGRIDGSGYFGVRRKGDELQLKLEYELTHKIGNRPAVDVSIAYEGSVPQKGALAFLIPFVWKDDTTGFFVFVVEVTKKATDATQTNQARGAGVPELSYGPVMECSLLFKTNGMTDPFCMESNCVVNLPTSSHPSDGISFLDDKDADTIVISVMGDNLLPVQKQEWDMLSEARRADLVSGNFTLAWDEVAMVKRTDLPATCLFRTRSGHAGIFQVFGLTNGGGGVGMRYKFVMDSRASVRFVARDYNEAFRPNGSKPIPREAVELYNQSRELSIDVISHAHDMTSQSMIEQSMRMRREKDMECKLRELTHGTLYEGFWWDHVKTMRRMEQLDFSTDREKWMQAFVEMHVARFNMARLMADAGAADFIHPHAADLKFGPWNEATVLHPVAGSNCCISFDSGRLLTPPSAILAMLMVTNGADTVTSEYMTGAIDWGRYRAASRTTNDLVRWMEEAQVDTMPLGSNELVVLCPAHGLMPTEETGNSSDWEERITPAWLLLRLDVNGKLNRLKPSNAWEVLRFPSDAGLEGNELCLFRTRTGRYGILQITGFTENPRGVKLRYKLVRNAVSSPTESKAASPANRSDQIAVEDLALRMIVAIREKDNDTLKSLATDRIKGWRDALPVFAVELRERYRQNTGNEAFDLRAGESLVDGDLAVVRCTGPAALQGKCLVPFFVKTADGWRNHSLRSAMQDVSLANFMADCKKEIEREQTAAAK